ncbi:MAG: PqiC family protein [Betaproteobacteria bacterium]|nr:PqiC family protein [Betaproteobacteria bacterium]
MTTSRSTSYCFAAVLALAGTGCGSSPKTLLYSLQAVAAAPKPDRHRAESRLYIVVGPVALPERVDRPQIVTLTGEHSVHASDFNRWAEPLKVAFPRQLAADLGRELGSTRVRIQGQESVAEADLRIEVDVLRFEAALGESAVVEAIWTLRRKGEAPRSGRSFIRERLTADGYAALVAGLGRATAGVGRDLAAAIREMG